MAKQEHRNLSIELLDALTAMTGEIFDTRFSNQVDIDGMILIRLESIKLICAIQEMIFNA